MLRLLTLTVWLCLSLLAQADDLMRVLSLDVAVKDKYQQPYRVRDGSAFVGVRLVHDENQNNFDVRDFKSLSSAGIEYRRNSDEYLKFPVQNGSARVQFVILPKSNAPVDYEVVLIDQRNQTHRLNPTRWSVGPSTTHNEVIAEGLRAPHRWTTLLAAVAFGLAGLLVSYLLLGRLLFIRMLDLRNLDVVPAERWSNMLLLSSWALLLLAVAVMVWFPYWQGVFWWVPALYFLVVTGMYGVGHLLTRPAASNP